MRKNTFTVDSYYITEDGAKKFTNVHKAETRFVDGDLIYTTKRLRRLALELVNEWNRRAMIGSMLPLWHYVLVKVSCTEDLRE
jgi:hypothetical protein